MSTGQSLEIQIWRLSKFSAFVHFTAFMQTEARIACNPIASPFLMNIKNTDERLPKRDKALNTSAQMKISTSGTPENSKPKPPCLVCKDETHGVVKCPTFAAKTTDEKKVFIHENHLCFGCLRKATHLQYMWSTSSNLLAHRKKQEPC